MSICLILDMKKQPARNVGRPQKCRIVKRTPLHTYYKPAGIPMTNLKEVAITIDEIEAVRLSDYNGLYHEKAAEKMDISRQTFSRILSSAHKKISDGIINGKAIKFKGGNYNFVKIGNTMNDNKKKGLGNSGECMCPKCETSISHKRGVPCHDSKCPECGSKMLRVGSDHHKQWLNKKNNK